MKRSYRTWTELEINYLKENFFSSPQEELSAALQNRGWQTITSQAYKLGLKRDGFAKKKANLEILLHDNPVTYYWLGFLLADGSFDNRRIHLGVAHKDLSHLKMFLSFVNSTNKLQTLYEGTYHRVKLTNISVVKALKEKFNISSRKTYEPCDIKKIINPELLFSLIVGFIDGDGSVCKNKLSNSYCVSIVGHMSWLDNFLYIQEFLSTYFNIPKLALAKIRDVSVKLPQNTHKTQHKLVNVYFGTKMARAIKNKADELGLPFLKRKLGIVPQSF